MPMMQLIYRSRPFGFDESILAGILMQARRNNTKNDVTGALIVRRDLYLQLLEGPEHAVTRLYEHIEQDNRHLEVARISAEPVSERLFPAWSMRDDPARSWLWTAAEVADGALATASPGEVRCVFERLTREE